MMKSGVDAKALAEHAKTLSTAEKIELFRHYKQWIQQGARAQGAIGMAGVITLALAALVAVELAIYRTGSPLTYLLCAVAAGLGLALARVGFRREREWRGKNPFRY